MNIPLTKLKAILLYFCKNTNPRFLGKTKLMKLFYFLDFLHIKRYGVPVTYDEYYHLEHGPIPTIIKNLIDNLADNPDDSVLSDTIIIEKNEGQNLQRVVKIRELNKEDESLLSKSELDVLGEVCARFGEQSTKIVEKASHEEAPWLLTNELEKISYSLASKDPDCQIASEDLELLDKVFSCK